MKNNKDKIGNIKEKFKDILNDPQKKAILMLVLMFIFFSLLVMGTRSAHNKNSKETTNHSDFEFSLNKINANNYHYTYDINLDSNIISYEGDRYSTKELFTKNSNGTIEQFYNYNEIYLKNINNVWSKTDNPYLFSDFKMINKIEQILKQSTYISYTEFKDNKKIYTYNISTTTLIKILELVNVDLDDLPNVITITTDKDNNVIQIDYDLSEYSKYKMISTTKATATIKYSKFGEIEEIEDPT